MERIRGPTRLQIVHTLQIVFGKPRLIMLRDDIELITTV